MAVLGVLYACIMIAFTALANRAEREWHAFPFKDEDWLRYLLPARFGPGAKPRILLAGPSTVRENLRYERFEARLPAFAIQQGGISLGTLDDTTVALEYMGRAYGEAALPDFMIVGLAPRFVANIPDERPFRLGVDRYSPHFSTRTETSGIVLVPKSPLEGLLARARFLVSKEPQRFRTALLAAAHHWISEDGSPGQAVPADGRAAPPPRGIIDRLMQSPPAALVIRRLGLSRVLTFTSADLLAWMISPYKYSLSPHLQYTPGPGLRSGWWTTTYDWDPRENEQATRAKLQRLLKLADACGIALAFVNMPERDVSRAQFDEGKYRAYLDLVQSAIEPRPFLEMRDFLRTDEFHDREHSLPAGSLRLTDAIIDRLQSAILATSPPQRSRRQGCLDRS